MVTGYRESAVFSFACWRLVLSRRVVALGHGSLGAGAQSE
jgi:hypothetical protein